IFHYLLAGWQLLWSCFPLIYVVFGIVIITGKFDAGRNPPPPGFGFLIAAFGLGIRVLLGGMALAKILAGRCLTQQKHLGFCFAVACVECLHVPMGTALGVFTIIVLIRPSVKAL